MVVNIRYIKTRLTAEHSKKMELNIQLGYCQSQRAQFVYFAYHLTRTMMHQEGMQYFGEAKKNPMK